MKLVLFISALLLSSNSFASLIINTDPSSGLIIGLTNVEIDNRLYNADFEGGSFNEVYGSLDTILNEVRGNERKFTQALVDIFNSPNFTSYKGKPLSFHGCTNIYACNLVTPYDVDTRGSTPTTYVDGYSAVFVDDFGPRDSYVGAFMWSPTYFLNGRGRYVKWSLVQVSESNSLSLFCLAILILLIGSYKNKLAASVGIFYRNFGGEKLAISPITIALCVQSEVTR